MTTLLALTLTCWCCARIALLSKPLPGNAVEECVYGQLLGRGHRLVLLAVGMTVVALFALVVQLPQRGDVTLADAPSTRICFGGSSGQSTCFTPQQEGMWVCEERSADGTWHVTGISLSPPQAPADGNRAANY